jgi:hypothetical protein
VLARLGHALGGGEDPRRRRLDQSTAHPGLRRQLPRLAQDALRLEEITAGLFGAAERDQARHLALAIAVAAGAVQCPSGGPRRFAVVAASCLQRVFKFAW